MAVSGSTVLFTRPSSSAAPAHHQAEQGQGRAHQGVQPRAHSLFVIGANGLNRFGFSYFAALWLTLCVAQEEQAAQGASTRWPHGHTWRRAP